MRRRAGTCRRRGSSSGCRVRVFARSRSARRLTGGAAGQLQIVGPECADAALLEVRAPARSFTRVAHAAAQAREAAWKRMSEAGRSQFAWPEPGILRLEGDPPLDEVDASLIQNQVRVFARFVRVRANPAWARQSPPLPTFCLVVLTVDEARCEPTRACSLRLSAACARRWTTSCCAATGGTRTGARKTAGRQRSSTPRRRETHAASFKRLGDHGTCGEAKSNAAKLRTRSTSFNAARVQRKLTSSTSKIRVELGGMTGGYPFRSVVGRGVSATDVRQSRRVYRAGRTHRGRRRRSPGSTSA